MILFLSNADTELLALRVAVEGMPEGFPAVRAANPAALADAPPLDGVDAVLVRLLGGKQAWADQFEALRRDCVAAGVALLAFGGEAVPDADLTAASTVPSATVTEAFGYLVQGGVANLEHLLRFVADTVLYEGFGFDAPAEVPAHGLLMRRKAAGVDDDEARPTVGVICYRAHVLAGNTQFVVDLCDALSRFGVDAVCVYTYSLRPGPVGEGSPTPAIDLLVAEGVDAVITTTLAAGSLDEETESWDPGSLAMLDVPVIQAICATSPGSVWEDSKTGLTPVDVAMAVAIPEFDGRIVSVPVSFKETVDADDLLLGAAITAYRSRPDRVDRVAELAARLASFSSVPTEERKVALVLSAYPTKRSRLGNAVGLDTPASIIVLLDALRDAGYRIDRVPHSGDELMAESADTFGYGEKMPSPKVSGPSEVPGHSDGPGPSEVEGPWDLAGNAVGYFGENEYRSWFATLPQGFRSGVEEKWGRAPGSIQAVTHQSGTALAFSGIDLGNVVVCVQPPRGSGGPIAVYHSPDLPPTHHYLGFYRWLDSSFGAMAVVHVGKHGSLEWLPGKGVGLSAGCGPDAALGSMPMVYPFVVNDPGEGAQAKRRAHAVIVDHLVPPLTRADTYDDLAALESLLDEHARLTSLDPGKLPAIRKQVWECLVAAEIHRDMGLAARASGHVDDANLDETAFDDPAFDDVLLQVDGYLCEFEDAQIRGGLHILGRPPEAEAEIDMVLAITRHPQGRIPSFRVSMARSLGSVLDDTDRAGYRQELDRVEEESRRLLVACQQAGWVRAGAERSTGAPLAVGSGEELSTVVDWICGRLVPALRATTGEVGAVGHFLDGGFIPPGPSGAPSRGQAHVLPTGRNFYAVDPRGSRRAWRGTSVGRLPSASSNVTWQKRVAYLGRWGWWCGGRLRCALRETTSHRRWPSSASGPCGQKPRGASRDSR